MADALVRFATPKHWHDWLAKHHASMTEGVWLELAKKSASFTTVTYAEALEVALCWGWIDGQKGAVDEHRWKQRFTPRRERSIWSKVNRAKAEALIAERRMQPSGLHEVTRAKADGRWERAYDSPKNAKVPDDLALALSKSPKAKAMFESLDSANRYAILYRTTSVKKAETRARKIAAFVAGLAKGEVPHPDRLPKKKKAQQKAR